MATTYIIEHRYKDGKSWEEYQKYWSYPEAVNALQKLSAKYKELYWRIAEKQTSRKIVFTTEEIGQ